MIVISRRISGRTKLRGRERHIPEDRARIILLGGNTFLIGYAIFGCIDQILCGTNDANYGEYSKGDGQIATVRIVQCSVDPRGDGFGNIVATAATATARLFRFTNSRVQNNGVDYLHDGNGNVFRRAAGLGKRTIIRGVGITLENADVAFASVKDYLLLQYGDSFKFLTPSATQACLEYDLNIEFDRYRIESAIKSNGIDPDIGPCDARALRANIGGVLQHIVSKIGQ